MLLGHHQPVLEGFVSVVAYNNKDKKLYIEIFKERNIQEAKNNTVHSSFLLVENCDLLENGRTADAISMTSQSMPFQLSIANRVLCFVSIMITLNGYKDEFDNIFHFFII